MDNDLKMCEMQHMIDGQQFTIEAQQETINNLHVLIADISTYFTLYLEGKDRYALELMKERRK